MIEFLKESTFAVNDVLHTAWRILKSHYLSIAGLCFMMFIVSYFSSLLANIFLEYSILVRLLMVLLFIILYFGLQLTLFKYTFRLLNNNEEEDVAIQVTIPTIKEITYFFTGTFYFVICIILMFFISSILIFPLLYVVNTVDIAVKIAITLGTILAFMAWIRTSFFPFFILDKHFQPFKSLRFSLAITRGNFTRVFLLLFFFFLFTVLSWYLNDKEYYILSFGLSLLTSFLINPLATVSLVVAYRQMMDEYEGEADPEIMHNII